MIPRVTALPALAIRRKVNVRRVPVLVTPVRNARHPRAPLALVPRAVRPVIRLPAAHRAERTNIPVHMKSTNMIARSVLFLHPISSTKIVAQ